MVASLIAFLLGAATPGQLLSMSVEGLIEKFTELNLESPLGDGVGGTSEFAPLGVSPSFVEFRTDKTIHEPDPVYRELVRRGADALPALLKHVDDSRPTKTVFVPETQFEGMWFERFYDARDRNPLTPKPFPPSTIEELSATVKSYTFTVGDFCYEAIGDIVNRGLGTLYPVPGPCVEITSPIQCKELAKLVRKDWGHLSRGDHLASLSGDLYWVCQKHSFRAALVRLWFYYPKDADKLIVKLLARKLYDCSDLWTFWVDLAGTDADTDWKSRLATFEKVNEEIPPEAFPLWLAWVPWESMVGDPPAVLERVSRIMKSCFPSFDPSHPKFLDSADLRVQAELVGALGNIDSPTIDRGLYELFKRASVLKPTFQDTNHPVDDLCIAVIKRLAGKGHDSEMLVFMAKRVSHLSAMSRGDVSANSVYRRLEKDYKEAIASLGG